jgi:glycosyltransferase involved in cell wall biosynthesis
MKPKILFLNSATCAQHGATGRILTDLMASLRADCDPIVMGREPIQRLQGVTYFCQSMHHNPRSVLSMVWFYMRLLISIPRLPKINMVISMTDPPFMGFFGWSIARLHRAPHIHWVQDVYPDILPVFGYPVVLKSLMRRMMHAADALVVIGRCMAQRIALPCHVIENWSEIDFYDPIRTPNEPFRILYAGTCSGAHRTLFNDGFENVYVDFVGKGSEFVRLKNHYANDPKICFLDPLPQDQIEGMMRQVHVHLVTLNDQAVGCMVPSKFYSAMACGKPVLFLGSRESEIAQIINAYKIGIVVDGDVRLSHAIAILKNDYDLYQSHVIQARHIFLAAQSLKKWHSLMDHFLKEKS